MKHFAFVAVVGLVGLPLPASAEAPAAIKTEDCATYFKAKAQLPRAFSELQKEVANNIEMHIKWQSGAKDKASRAEVAFLKKVLKENRALSAAAARLAKLMASASFAPSPHDMSKMDPNAGKEMAKQATLQHQFAGLLNKDAAQTEKMLAAMKGQGAAKMARRK